MTRFQTGLPAAGKLSLQRCGQCGQVNYPPRELCGNCLADALEWAAVADTGTVRAVTQLHYSLEPEYAAHLPWTIASVQLDCGPQVLAHLPPGIATGSAVTLKIVEDKAGNRMLLAQGLDKEAQKAAAAWLAKIQFKEVSL